MLLPSAVHVSSTFEFGAMYHDCLSADPQVQSSTLKSYSETHELIDQRFSCFLHHRVWSPEN